MARVKAKTFDVANQEKGSPFQTKVNAHLKGKNITGVHAVSVVNVPQAGENPEDLGSLRGTIIYTEDEGADVQPRVYSKVLQNVPQNSDLQTKINAFTKGKDIDVLAATVASDGETATVVLIYTGPEGEGDDVPSAEASAEDAPAEESAPEEAAQEEAAEQANA